MQKITQNSKLLIVEIQDKVVPNLPMKFRTSDSIFEWLWESKDTDIRVQVFGPDTPAVLWNRDQLMITGSGVNLPIMESKFSSWDQPQIMELVRMLSGEPSKYKN